MAKAKSPDGRPGFVHTLAHDGSILDPLRDTYDHAFVLLALASVYALDRDAQIRAEIDALMCVISMPNCARPMAAFSRDGRRRCRAGKIRRCICSRR